MTRDGLGAAHPPGEVAVQGVVAGERALRVQGAGHAPPQAPRHACRRFPRLPVRAVLAVIRSAFVTIDYTQVISAVWKCFITFSIPTRIKAKYNQQESSNFNTAIALITQIMKD